VEFANGSDATERLTDDADDRGEVREDGLIRHPDDAITKASELALAASVSALPAAMVAAIDLDDELPSGSEEICDEGPDGDLPAERDAELLRAKRLPEASLGRGGGVPEPGGVGSDDGGVMRGGLMHGAPSAR